MKQKTAQFIKKAMVILFAVACLFALFLPLPKRLSGGEFYDCVWADGSVTRESFSSAYKSLSGIDGENIILSRDGLTGRIASGAKKTYETLERGSLPELLECRAEGTRIDGAALYRAFLGRVWYDGEYYVWTGEKIERVSRAEREEIVFLEGAVTARVLNAANAATVYLRAGATLSASSFVNSRVERVYVEAPYSERGGAIYIDTAGGKRLLAATGGIEELTLDGDLAFADEGALLACTALTSLAVPFLGSAKSPYGTQYTGELAYLFSNGKEYRVPETLVSVKVTGGRIVPFAFYACPKIKEIDACGVEADEISENAFSGLESLEILHTAKSNVYLTGEFTAHTAECGCTVYTRLHSQK